MAHEFEKKWRSKDVRLQENVDFSVMLLKDRVLCGLTKAGFKKPSPIQLEAIPVGRVGKDLVVQAKAGTGKTLVFTIIALNQLKYKLFRPQVLILAPTREIATQICSVIQSVGSAFTKLKCCSFIGGLSVIDDKENALTCQIAVGTPGRVRQLIKSGFFPTNCIRLLVFDEADQLLQGTFKSEIDDIFNALPKEKQVIATSATYPAKLRKTIFQYFREPHLACLNANELALLGIVHYTEIVKKSLMPLLSYKFKLDALQKILNGLKFSQCLVFCNGISRVEVLCQDVRKWGYSTTYISSAKDQPERLKAMSRLKSFKCKVFISSDVSSRGIDAENVDLVVNFDLPYSTEIYLHRVGRAGRYGSIGVAVTLITDKEIENMGKIESDGAFKSYKLPDPLPLNLIQNPCFGEYTIPEPEDDETKGGVNDIDNSNTKANGNISNENESHSNGMPFGYNYIDFNKLKGNEKQDFTNNTNQKMVKKNFVEDTKLNVTEFRNGSDHLNQSESNNSNSEQVTKVTARSVKSDLISKFEESVNNNNEVTETPEIILYSDKRDNCTDILISAVNENVDMCNSVGDKIYNSDQNEMHTTKTANDIKYEDLSEFCKIEEKSKNIGNANLYGYFPNETENGCENNEGTQKYTNIYYETEKFILNYEENKDKFSLNSDESESSKNSFVPDITSSMLEKLKRDRSSYFYKVFKCYEEHVHKSKVQDEEECVDKNKELVHENKEESVHENKDESVHENETKLVHDNKEESIHENKDDNKASSKISAVHSGMNHIYDLSNKEDSAKYFDQGCKPKLRSTPKVDKLFWSGTHDSESDSSSSSEKLDSDSVPLFVPQNEDCSDPCSSEESSDLDIESSSSISSSSSKLSDVHQKMSYGTNKSSVNRKHSDISSCSLKKPVYRDKNAECCARQSSCFKYISKSSCTKASQNYHGNSYKTRNCQNKECRGIRSSHIPKQKCHGSSCSKCNIPRVVNCYVPSNHQCHLPGSSRCTYPDPALCHMWYNTFQHQLFQIQRCMNHHCSIKF